jgi:hypothetical protein
MHTTSVDGGLICEMHHRQEMHAVRERVLELEDQLEAMRLSRDEAKDKCAVLLSEALRLERERDAVSPALKRLVFFWREGHQGFWDTYQSDDVEKAKDRFRMEHPRAKKAFMRQVVGELVYLGDGVGAVE